MTIYEPPMPTERTFQQVLTMTTVSTSLRSEAQGWGWEDSSLYVGEPVGANRSWRDFNWPRYPHVLAALADGWKLLAPPVTEKDGTASWWLVREVSK